MACWSNSAATCCYLLVGIDTLSLLYKYACISKVISLKAESILQSASSQYTPYTEKPSASLHCCEYFMGVALRTSLSRQSLNWLQAAVDNIYTMYHVKVMILWTLQIFSYEISSAQCLDLFQTGMTLSYDLKDPQD